MRLMAMPMLLLWATLVAAQPRPTFVAEFDDGFDAGGPNGAVAATLEGAPELVDGRFGKALRSGPGSGYLRFPAAGIVSREAGTVEMWVCPLDWSGDEERFHVFFDLRGDGAFYLYKYYQGGLLMLSCPHINGPYHSAAAPIAGWRPGEWHHIAGTWSEREQNVYIDGRRLGSTTPGLPVTLGESFVIGDHPWHIERSSSSLIDRVRIYDRCLSDAHIAAHYAGDYDRTVPLGPDSCRLGFRVDPAARRVELTVDTTADDIADARAEFALQSEDAPLVTAPQVAFHGALATATLDLADVPAGAYRLTATLRRGAEVVGALERPFHVISTAWRGNQLGRQAMVPAPWTPVQTTAAGDERTVTCWGRSYRFGRDGLPVSIVSAGEELLARPVRLRLTAAGAELVAQPGRLEQTGADPIGVELQGESRVGTVAVAAASRTEYDGLVVFDVTIDAPADAGLERATLDIPLRPEVVYYRHRWAPAWAGITGNLPAGEGVVDQAAFLPYAWLGDNDRGLFWCCESGEGWPNFAAPNAFETAREAGAVVLRLNLLAGQPAPAPWRYRFCLQAPPVKSLPPDWRKWRMLPAPGGNISIIWPTPQPDSMAWYGYPASTQPELFRERVEKLHAAGGLAVPYSCLSFFSGAAPEWPWFEREWTTGSGDSSSSDVAAYGAVFERINPTSESYSDFIVAKNVEFVTTYGLDGLYHDNTHPYELTPNSVDGGWTDAAGRWHPRFPILAYRDLYRRLYIAVREVNPKAWLMAHMSGKVTAPILAYEDAYLDGEHFRGHVKDCYLDLLSLDTFRAEFMGRQWGLMPYFLPEFNAEYQKPVEPTRGLMGLLLAHDVAPWPIWCNLEPVKEIYAALDAFGYVDSEFLPYFDPNPPATTDMADVLTSAYRRADGRALVVIANVGREDRVGTVTLNAARLGLPLDTVITWPERAAVDRDGSVVKLAVPGLGYRLLLVGAAP